MKEHWSKTQAAIPFLREKTKILTDTLDAYEKNVDKAKDNIDKTKKKIEILPDGPDRKKEERVLELLEKAHEKLVEGQEKEMLVKTRQFKEHFAKVIEVIQDPTIPTWGPNNVTQVLRKNSETTIFEGDKYYLDDGRVVFMIVLPSDYERTMESFNRQFIEFSVTDGSKALIRLQRMLEPKKPINKK
jgi:hypothetical protein